MFGRAEINIEEIPVVPKSHDDAFLRPARTWIGERECSCGEQCICMLMARIRHGPTTDLAFVGTEFLLPMERANFLATGSLPTRQRKCLVCTRYWQHYVYLRARTDPAFRLDSTNASLQVFGNVVLGEQSSNAITDADEMPLNASLVSSRDGYKPSALLFVDEGYADTNRLSREGRTAAYLWKPVVRFCAAHYEYVRRDDGPTLVQIGIGSDVKVGSSLTMASFGVPPAAKATASAALSKKPASTHGSMFA